MTMQVEPNEAHELALEVNPSTRPLEDEACKELPDKKKTPCCTKLKAFLAALCFSYFCKGYSGATTKSTFTQLERRFGLSSSTAGFVDGSFELGNLLVIVFVSYYGAKFHRPRIIAIGSCVMSLGSFLIAMPHFFMGYYKYETIVRSSGNITFDASPCSRNHTVAGLEGIPGSGCEKETSSNAWIYVLLGNMLRGIGETPITPLGISYLDDFSKKEDSPFYIGILHTVAMFGPMAGFLLGSLFARLYVDIGFVDMDTINITLTDSRWVGAWWLGFVVAGVINLISAIPFFFMPKSLNEEDEPGQRQKFLDAAKQNGDGHQVPRTQEAVKLHSSLKDFFKSLKRLLTNGMYVVMLCITLLQFSSFIGYMTYNPKYMEHQYSQSASRSNVVTGLIIFPAVSVGMLLGGFIIKKYKLGMIGTTKLAFGSSFVAFLITLLYVVTGCENRTVAGLTVSYEGQPVPWHASSLSSTCNFDCNCAANQWDPVCGEDGITYVSACFAGCKNLTRSGENTVFHNCSCLENTGFMRRNLTAVLGECPRSDECSRKFIYFIVIKLINSFIYSLGATSFYMIMIRCIDKDLKSLAVGVFMLIMRALAGIPAPAYIGAAIDRTCLKWARTSCGRQGACRLYDATAIRHTFWGLVLGLRAPSYLLAVLFFWLVKKKFGRKEADATENQRQEDGNSNEDAKPHGADSLAAPLEAEKETSM